MCVCVCACVFWLQQRMEESGELANAGACFASKARLAANQSAGASLRDSSESITGWPGGAGSI